ncbi:MAG TPA: flavodoxin domain-containing protein [Vicinamibacterales bacterium]
MEPRSIAVLYATSHGHTEQVARRIADVATLADAVAYAFDLNLPPSFAFDQYDLIVLAGSVEFGRHQRRLERFVKRNREKLARVDTAFVSVSGAAITPGGRVEAARFAEDFYQRTGWRPSTSLLVGGAYSYTRYGFFTKWMMKRLAAQHGFSTDTTHDHAYTNWPEVEKFAVLLAKGDYRGSIPSERATIVSGEALHSTKEPSYSATS